MRRQGLRRAGQQARYSHHLGQETAARVFILKIKVCVMHLLFPLYPTPP